MKKILSIALLTFLSSSVYAFGLDDAVNATEKASEAAQVVDDTGLVKGSEKVAKGAKTASEVTKTAADTMGEIKKEDEKTAPEVKAEKEADATTPEAKADKEADATAAEIAPVKTK